jgi:ATP-dependent RNA helicase DeaD
MTSAAVGGAPGREPPPRMPIDEASGEFVTFQVSWGAKHGADTRRLLAIACRRGEIESKDIGAIRIGPASSLVEVRRHRADAFGAAAARPDPRDPRVRFRVFDPARATDGGRKPPPRRR